MNYSPHPHPNSLLPPPLETFDRLIIQDGLQITAERWKSAHKYHRQRQNFHYQSLHQNGIVHGLGVVPVEPPSKIRADYRDRRWVQIQPGMAIDAFGNPIVIKDPEDFRIAASPPDGETWDVIIVAQYVDPDEVSHPSTQEHAPEKFRIVEKRTVDVTDVELCRIRLDARFTEIHRAADVYQPSQYQLDFRYRSFVQHQPWGIVRVAHLKQGPSADANTQALAQLLASTDALFPSLRGDPHIPVFSFKTLTQSDLTTYDAIFIAYSDVLHLKGATLTCLKTYLDGGGTILVVIQSEADRLSELRHTHQELVAGLQALDESIAAAPVPTPTPAPIEPESSSQLLAQSLAQSSSGSSALPNEGGQNEPSTAPDRFTPKPDGIRIATTAIKSLNQPDEELTAEYSPELDNPPDNHDDLAIRDRLQSEISAYGKEIRQTVQSFNHEVNRLAKKMDYPLKGGRVDVNHPIRRYPFLFSQFPLVNGQPVSLSSLGGIVVMVGDLTSSWDIQESRPQSRETIRTAQELGINLLHFAWRRRHFMQLQHRSPAPTNTATPQQTPDPSPKTPPT